MSNARVPENLAGRQGHGMAVGLPEDRPPPAAAPAGESPGMVITRLAELPAGAYLDAAGLGAILGRCKRSIQRAWKRGELPPPVTFMGRHVWIVGTIVAHMQARQAAVVRQVARGPRGQREESA